MRIFNFITLAVAILISICAAFYSIVGLTAIFAAAFWPIVIMGSALEMGKLVGAVWLHLHWERAEWWIKTYMVPAVAALMLITSMGIFGFLSKAHIEQTNSSSNLTTQLAQLSLDIDLEQKKIDNNKKLIEQLDSTVDSLLKSSATQGSQTRTGNAQQAARLADQASKLRKTQEAERSKLQSEIALVSSKIADLSKQKLIVEQEVKAITAEVGPIKYVASMMYGDDPDSNSLEKAVKWMIVLLVIVFDPLAVVLILAATSGLRYHAANLKKKIE